MQIIRQVTILLISLTAAFAAQPAASPAAVAQWEAALSAREKRAALFRDELKALDARIEARVDSLLGALRAIADSKDSGSKVARMKEQTIKSLHGNIGYYQNKRSALQAELHRPTLNLTEEQKRRGIAVFDARIEKRIAQILEIQKSLPTHKDYARYKATGSNYYGTTYALNDDHLQNQRVTTVTNRQRREIEEELRKSIARLEQNNRSLKAQISAAPAAAQAKVLSAEIAKNDALIAERRKQIAAALLPDETQTRKIGQREALDLDKALSTSVAELRRDFNTLFAHYNALILELSAINTTRAAIAASKAPVHR